MRATASMREGDLGAALRLAEKSLRLNPGDARVLELQRRIQAAMTAADAGADSPVNSPATPGSGRAASPPKSATSAGAERSHTGRPDGLRGSGGGAASSAAAADGTARSRPAAQARTAAPGGGAASSSASARNHAPPVRPHTPEQAAAVRSIKAAADYYEVLGVAKDATAEDIKRVGRKAGRTS